MERNGAKPTIAVFSGPSSTIANSPTLVTSNKGRLEGEHMLSGRFDHLVPQTIHEPVTVKIRKYSAHPLEEDAKAVYHDDGKDYYEVELRPEDGPYLLPYMARRANGAPQGEPFEEGDLLNAAMQFGGRQFFYPDASRLFAEIDRTIGGRDEHGEGNILDREANFDFIRALPPSGYTQKGEKLGVDYFPYKPFALGRNTHPRNLATVTNVVHASLSGGKYAGSIWLEGSPTVEETIYWLSLLIDTDLPMTACAAQRPHGQLSSDGDRNLVDAVSYILSGQGAGAGAVGVQDEQIFAAREFKKTDDRPGNYTATGGHGGILGTIGPPVTLWYKPAYKHTSRSEVNMSRLPTEAEFTDTVGDTRTTKVAVKNSDGTLRGESIPRVHIVKYGQYSEEDEGGASTPDGEVDIMARIQLGLEQQRSADPSSPKFHGFVLEGTTPYAAGNRAQAAALAIAAFSGMPVVRVARGDPAGRVPSAPRDLTIEGSNLSANKARLLMMASMLKLGRLPRAKDPRNPTREEREAVVAKLTEFQEIFETH